MNGLLDQFLGVKVHHIDGLAVDSGPEGLELRHGQLFRGHLQLHIVAPGILRLHGPVIVHGVQNFQNRIGAVCRFFRNLHLVVGLILEELVGQSALAVHIAVDNQIIADGLSQGIIHHLFIARGISEDFTLEQVHRDRTGTIRHGFSHFRLQSPGKAVIALTGYHCQHIDVVYVVSQHIGVHALAVLVDA